MYTQSWHVTRLERSSPRVAVCCSVVQWHVLHRFYFTLNSNNNCTRQCAHQCLLLFVSSHVLGWHHVLLVLIPTPLYCVHVGDAWLRFFALGMSQPYPFIHIIIYIHTYIDIYITIYWYIYMYVYMYTSFRIAYTRVAHDSVSWRGLFPNRSCVDCTVVGARVCHPPSRWLGTSPAPTACQQPCPSCPIFLTSSICTIRYGTPRK